MKQSEASDHLTSNLTNLPAIHLAMSNMAYGNLRAI
ncbi:hypothetical protein [Rhodopirellula baltica]